MLFGLVFETADTEFDYLVPDEIWPVQMGQRVKAPFGRNDKLEKGFCVEADIPQERAFEAAGRGLITTWPAPPPVLGLDYIWLSEHFVPLRTRLCRTLRSDHALVIADVQVGRTRE